MADGRLDGEALAQRLREAAKSCRLLDMDNLAETNGAMINAVMLGLIAGSGVLPMATETFEGAIKEEGKGVDANIRGFHAGLAAIRGAAGSSGSTDAAIAAAPPLAGDHAALVPEAARDFVADGVRRLAAYQDDAYAQRYLERLKPICEADRACGAHGALAREVARYLALRMAYEDVIRVAEIKTDATRVEALRRARGARSDVPVRVVEFLKPGIVELGALLPPRLGHALIGFAERRGLLDQLSFGMRINSASVTGYVLLRTLARLKRIRRATTRHHDEQRWIETWLGDIATAAKIAPVLAIEIACGAALVKGYGETHRRGLKNYARIAEAVIRPALAGAITGTQASDAVANARVAALADPDGQRLDDCLSAIAERLGPSSPAPA
jgi:indolepyruvate ferredoxin oxidoreductase beta subunit